MNDLRPILDSLPASGSRMNRLKKVANKDEFTDLLGDERAIFFVYVPWAGDAKRSKAVIESWLNRQDSYADVYQIEPDQQPFIAQWLFDQGYRHLSSMGSGEVIWTQFGRIVAVQMHAASAGVEHLTRKTREIFDNGTGKGS
jgi:hypothetical protein